MCFFLIEIWVHTYQGNSLVLLLSSCLQLDNHNFLCSPEFTGSVLLKLPHYLLLLLLSTNKHWIIIIIINQHALVPLALLLKLKICYYVCKTGTGGCNGLSLPWDFTPFWFSKSELYTLVYSCVPNWISASSRENWGCKKTSKMYKNTLTAVI